MHRYVIHIYQSFSRDITMSPCATMNRASRCQNGRLVVIPASCKGILWLNTWLDRLHRRLDRFDQNRSTCRFHFSTSIRFAICPKCSRSSRYLSQMPLRFLPPSALRNVIHPWSALRSFASSHGDPSEIIYLYLLSSYPYSLF